MNLTAVPFGNAEYHSWTHTATCQHGELECVGNSWEQCAIAHYPATADWFPFYYCIEKNGDEGSTSLPTAKCAELANVDHDTLETCVNGAEAKELLYKAYQDTPKDHQYVPWVVINGKVWDQEGSFTKAVCKAYREGGGTEPDACNEELRSKQRPTKYELDYA